MRTYTTLNFELTCPIPLLQALLRRRTTTCPLPPPPLREASAAERRPTPDTRRLPRSRSVLATAPDPRTGTAAPAPGGSDLRETVRPIDAAAAAGRKTAPPPRAARGHRRSLRLLRPPLCADGRRQGRHPVEDHPRPERALGDLLGKFLKQTFLLKKVVLL